jgi:hypothetical protein
MLEALEKAIEQRRKVWQRLFKTRVQKELPNYTISYE